MESSPYDPYHVSMLRTVYIFSITKQYTSFYLQDDLNQCGHKLVMRMTYILHASDISVLTHLKEDQLPVPLVACHWCSAGELAPLDVAVLICQAGAAGQ